MGERDGRRIGMVGIQVGQVKSTCIKMDKLGGSTRVCHVGISFVGLTTMTRRTINNEQRSVR